MLIDCWLKAKLGLGDECDFGPTYRPDQAHIGLSEHFLMKAPNGPHLSKEEANDPRLLRFVCRGHHHKLDFGRLRLTRDQIPASVEEFAEEHGITWRLERDYGPRTREKAEA